MVMFALSFLKLVEEVYILRCMLLAGFCKCDVKELAITFAIYNGYVVRNIDLFLLKTFVSSYYFEFFVQRSMD